METQNETVPNSYPELASYSEVIDLAIANLTLASTTYVNFPNVSRFNTSILKHCQKLRGALKESQDASEGLNNELKIEFALVYESSNTFLASFNTDLDDRQNGPQLEAFTEKQFKAKFALFKYTRTLAEKTKELVKLD